MLLEKVRIQNFRNMKDVTVPLGRFAVMVGPNNIGKTSILQALEYVFAPVSIRNIPITKTDFLDPSKSIVIDIWFNKINDNDKAVFYHDEGLINPKDDSIHIRFLSTWSSVEQDVNNECYFIRDDLPEDQQRVSDFYSKYKQAVPFFLISSDRQASREIGLTKNRDLGRVLRIYSSDYLKPIATLRSDIQNTTMNIKEQKGNWVGFPNDEYEVIDEYIADILRIIQNDYPKQLSTMNGSELDEKLNEINEQWPNVSAPLVELLDQNLQVPYEKLLQTILEKIPILIKRARVQLSLFELRNGILEERPFEEMNDGFKEIFNEMLPDQAFNLSLFSIQDDELITQVSVDFDEQSILNTGSGYQSLFVIGLKLVRTLAQLRFSENIQICNFVLGVEEPENHLHPHMQRHFINFIKRIQKLWKDEGYLLQIIITTHSPSVVSRFEPFDITILQKMNGSVKATQFTKEDYEQITNLDGADKEKQSKLKRQLQHHLELVLEQNADVFFSNLIIIVEGETEKGAIPFWASKYSNPINFDRLGLYILEAGGTSLKHYCTILQAFDIDFVLLCDSGDEHDTSQVDPKFVFTTEQKAFEKSVLHTAKISNLIRAIQDAVPESRNENRMNNIRGSIPSFSKLSSFEKLIEYLENPENQISEEDDKKLRKEIFNGLKDNKGLLLGRCIARHTNEDEIPGNIKAMFEYARKIVIQKTDKAYDIL